MQTTKQQLHRIFASWVLAGFWFLALIGMSVLSNPYQTSETEAFALDGSAFHTLAVSVSEPNHRES